MFRLMGEFHLRLVVSGVMTGITRMDMDSTGDPRLRVADGDMPGRVMVRL